MTAGQPSCTGALSFDLLFHNGWKSPGISPVIAYFKLQMYNLIAVTYSLLQGIQVSPTQLCMLQCPLFGFYCICGPTAARKTHQTLLLTILVSKVRNADMTASLAAPGSMCSSCCSILSSAGCGSNHCQQPGFALCFSIVASILKLHEILPHGLASRKDKCMHHSIALSNVVILL